MLPLRGYDNQGRKVFVYRMGCFPPDKIKVEDLEKSSGMVSDIAAYEGYQYIVVKYEIYIFHCWRNFFLDLNVLKTQSCLLPALLWLSTSRVIR